MIDRHDTAATKKPIRVLGLYSENVKMLRVADLTPNRHVNRVTGPNASGKSSIIESMVYALASAKSHPTHMIRNGEERMFIRLQLGDRDVEFTAIRRATADGETDLTLEAATGAVISKPQHLLDTLRDASGFEPIVFLRMDRKAQMETLRKIVTVDIDLDAVDGEIVKLMEDRRIFRPSISPLEDRTIKLRPSLDIDMDVTPISTAAMLDLIQTASAHNATIRQERTRREGEALHARNRRVEAGELREQARRLIEQAEGFERTAEHLERTLAALPPVGEPVDVDGLRGELAKVEAEKKAREEQTRIREEYSAAYYAHKLAVQKEEQMTTDIETLRQTKRDAIARAKMPVAGLSFGDEGVTFRDLPLFQASQAEQIRVAVGIWIAQDPVIRILLVRDASLLDDDSLLVIEEMAEEHDFQVFLEIVQMTPTVGIHMRAGEVFAIDGKPVSRPTPALV